MLVSITLLQTSLALCKPHLWRHVYRPSRLQIVKMCDSVAGRVIKVRRETDGDAHVLLLPDPSFAGVVNKANRRRLNGALVVEIICAYPTDEPVARRACRGYRNSVAVPRAGEHVRVSGALVRDRDHGGWVEIHPAGTVRKDDQDQQNALH
jgi:hypothetical protein